MKQTECNHEKCACAETAPIDRTYLGLELLPDQPANLLMEGVQSFEDAMNLALQIIVELVNFQVSQIKYQSANNDEEIPDEYIINSIHGYINTMFGMFLESLENQWGIEGTDPYCDLTEEALMYCEDILLLDQYNEIEDIEERQAAVTEYLKTERDKRFAD